MKYLRQTLQVSPNCSTFMDLSGYSLQPLTDIMVLMQVRKSAPHTSSFTHKCPLSPNFPSVLGLFSGSKHVQGTTKIRTGFTVPHLVTPADLQDRGVNHFFLTIIIRSPKTLCHCLALFCVMQYYNIKQSSNSCLSWIVFLKLSSLSRCGTKPSVFLIALKITPLFHIIISYQVFLQMFLIERHVSSKIGRLSIFFKLQFSEPPAHLIFGFFYLFAIPVQIIDEMPAILFQKLVVQLHCQYYEMLRCLQMMKGVRLQ